MLSCGLTYISSDECEDNETCLFTRPLYWLKKKYANSLHELDEMWMKGLSAKCKQMTRKRVGGAPLEREKPATNCPDYLVKFSHQQPEVEADVDAADDCCMNSSIES